MISGLGLGLVLFFTVVLGVIIVLLMRVVTQNEIIIRAIPLGSPKVQERRPPAPTSAAGSGAHRVTQEIN